jgi:hypothetical protein
MEPQLTDAELVQVRALLAERQAQNDVLAQTLVDAKQTAEGQLRGLVDEGKLSEAGRAVVDAALQVSAAAAPVELLKR